MTNEELLKQLLQSVPDTGPVDLEGGIIEAVPTTPNALVVDGWTQARGEQLVTEEWNVAEDGFTHRYSEHEITDAFAAGFEINPAVDPNCRDVGRRRWYETLLKSQKFQELHHTTCGDEFLAGLSAAQLNHQYAEYYASLTDQQKMDEEDPDTEPSLENELGRLRSVNKAVDKAGQEVQDASDVSNAFGLGKGQGAATDQKAMAKLFVAAKKNHTLRRIAELAGRYRRLAQSLQNAKPCHGMDDLVGIELGSDISRLTASELGYYTMPELKLDTLRRVVEGEAHCREYQSVAQENRGPIMVLVDESGSMSGEPIAQAKAMALSLAWLAQHQNRWCCLVGWSSESQVRELVIPPGEQNQEAIIDWCSKMWDGGTYPPVHRIQELFDRTNAPKGKTDLIWITDGSCSIHAHHVEQFNEFRRKHYCRSFTIGIGCEPYGFREVSDEVKTVDTLDVESEVVEEVLSI